MRHLLHASSVLLAVLVSSPVALADEAKVDGSKAEPPKIPYASYDSSRAVRALHIETRKILKEAQALEKAGKMDEALEKYRDAWRDAPYVEMQAELGLAEARAGHMLPCARNLYTAIRGWTLYYNDLRPIELMREVFAYCKKDLGTIAIKVNVPDTRITVDGEDVKEWPYVDEVFVEPGMHTIKAMKDGYWVNQTFVKIGPGERKPLSIAMQLRYESHHVAFGRPVTLNINANLGEKAEPTWPRNLMIASGVGVGLGVAALGTGVVMANNAESKSAAATWTGVAATGVIVAGLSLTGLIIGIASRPTPPNVIIQPQVSNDGAGVGVSGVIP